MKPRLDVFQNCICFNFSLKKIFSRFFVLKVVNLLNAINLDCHEEHKNFSGLFGILSCVVNTNLTVYNDDEEFGSISGIKNKSIVIGFVAENKKIYYIPRGISDHLPELTNFVITNSSLYEVTSKNLKEFPKLINLDLSYNSITILEKDVFQYNHKLKNIRLKNNLIFAIEIDAFKMFIKSEAILSSLNLYGNNCTFFSANSRSATLKVIGNMKEKCWNETSIKLYKQYKVQRRFEKIEAKIVSQKENLIKSNEKYLKLQNQTEHLQNDLQENNSTIFINLQHLNNTMNARIERNAKEMNEIISESYNRIQQTISKVNKVDVLENELNEMKQNLSSVHHLHNTEIHQLLDNLVSVLSKVEAINTENKLFISYCAKNDSFLYSSSISMKNFHTVLLLIIIVFQAIILCCNSHPKLKSNKCKSRSFTAPPSLEPVSYTTATQLVNVSPKGSQHKKIYESCSDIQSYDFVSTSEKQNNITIVQAEVEYQGLSNEIYGTVTASSEDLYSEVISPRKLDGNEKSNDDSDIYAVVEKFAYRDRKSVV